MRSDAKKQYDKEYYQKNKETIRAKERQKYWDNREERLVAQRRRGSKYYNANREKILDWNKKKYRYNIDGVFDRKSERQAGYWKAKRLKMFEVLGGAFCKKCDYKDWRALQVDHINGGGRAHVRTFSSVNTYNNYVVENPKEFQVLCANCNRIKVHENREVRQKEYLIIND